MQRETLTSMSSPVRYHSLGADYNRYLKAVRKYKKELSDEKKKLKETEKYLSSIDYNQRRWAESAVESIKQSIKWREKTIKEWMNHLKRLQKITRETKGRKIGRRAITAGMMNYSRKRKR